MLENRKTVLQKEQGMAFARAMAAGFTVDNISHLISFAECFGAARLLWALTSSSLYIWTHQKSGSISLSIHAIIWPRWPLTGKLAPSSWNCITGSTKPGSGSRSTPRTPCRCDPTSPPWIFPESRSRPTFRDSKGNTPTIPATSATAKSTAPTSTPISPEVS